MLQKQLCQHLSPSIWGEITFTPHGHLSVEFLNRNQNSELLCSLQHACVLTCLQSDETACRPVDPPSGRYSGRFATTSTSPDTSTDRPHPPWAQRNQDQSSRTSYDRARKHRSSSGHLLATKDTHRHAHRGLGAAQHTHTIKY